MKSKHLLMIVAGLFAACAERPVSNAPKTSPKPTPSASPTVSVTSTPQDGDYKGKGLVTKIDNNLGSVEIDHEEIKDLMPPMKMEFYVSDKKMLGVVAVGDRVDFVVRYKGGAETVMDLKKEKMSAIKFCKFHGFGNDYIVIDSDEIPATIPLPDLAREICQRNTGVGADGIAVLSKLDEPRADYFCEIINPDGSVAGFSGNGTRQAVSYLYYKKLWKQPDLKLATRSGIKNYSLTERIAEGHYWFEAEIGKPKFASNEVPVTGDTTESVIDRPIDVNGNRLLYSGVNVGNPVACIFVDSFDLDWRSYGRTMETHEQFPERANIVFVKVLDLDNIELRIWERGAGETSASGTCSSGAAVLSALTGRTNRTISVIAPGGTTEIHWRDDDEILITGRADLAFCGEWPVA